MSSIPLDQQQPQSLLPPPPPLVQVTQEAYTTHSSHGSVGAVVGVLLVITVLGIIAGLIGRLCSGRRVMHQQYDFEGWVERKCSSCIDGRIDSTPPPITTHSSPDSVPIAIPIQPNVEERKQPPPHQNPPASSTVA